MKRDRAYLEKTLKSARTFLVRPQGFNAEMWDLTISHKTLHILIQSQERQRNLLIACIDPKNIKGPVSWENCQIDVSIVMLSNKEGLGISVQDVSSSFEVIRGKIEVKENIKL